MNYALIIIFVLLPFVIYCFCLLYFYFKTPTYKVTKHALNRMCERYNHNFSEAEAQKFIYFLLKHQIRKVKYTYRDGKVRDIIICQHPSNHLHYPLVASTKIHKIITVYDPVKYYNYEFLLEE